MFGARCHNQKHHYYLLPIEDEKRKETGDESWDFWTNYFTIDEVSKHQFDEAIAEEIYKEFMDIQESPKKDLIKEVYSKYKERQLGTMSYNEYIECWQAICAHVEGGK